LATPLHRTLQSCSTP